MTFLKSRLGLVVVSFDFEYDTADAITLDKMQRIDIGLNSVTSLAFAWCTFGTQHILAIFQVDGKTLLSMHVLMI